MVPIYTAPVQHGDRRQFKCHVGGAICESDQRNSV